MGFLNPSDSAEVFYGSSGDVRDEINAHVLATTGGHYADEAEIPGSLIISSLRRATRLINTFLEPVYSDQIPFTVVADVPKFLDEASSDIATYLVFRSATAKLGRLPDEKKEAYYDQYVRQSSENPGFLVRIKDKDMLLPELTAVSPADAVNLRGEGHHPVFDIDDDTSQGPDADLLEDIARERQD